MEYVQERVATLHRLGGFDPATAPVAEAAVVVPMTDRDRGAPAAEAALSELERLSPARVFVPVRAPAERIGGFRKWLSGYDLPLSVLWCNAPAVEDLLAGAGLGDGFGKGRDVWLALGPAADAGEYVVVHDADATSYEGSHVARLLSPLATEAGFEFAKGYYARVEDGRLYGRLFRLCYEPLVRALSTESDAPVLDYLDSFRYALAGEFAATAEFAREIRAPPAWGLEVGTLGDAFAYAGFEGTVQVDLGRHVHDHRAVAGTEGLEGMSREVVATLLRVAEEFGVDPDYESLPDRFRAEGRRLVVQYRADAAHNGLAYDPASERDQVERYAGAIGPPGADRRLPAWSDAPFAPERVLKAARTGGAGGT
ncbi:glycosyl transferase family 2 [Saliphagus infecundisoli]|uniref:Glycosyl transferase family 2 n=1 Tax=Saliphagus infecundisoli TaxID=1849069 RepID=A0ABD5QEG7_9EURY|nr:glycosyl transferase family 2 [Saliphagus infecundisoli]